MPAFPISSGFTFPGSPLTLDTTGATLICAVVETRINPVLTITDSQNNVWVYSAVKSGDVHLCIAYSVRPVTSTSHQFAVPKVGADNPWAVVFAVGGTRTDAQVAGAFAGQAPLAAPSFQPGQVAPAAGDFVLTGCASDGTCNSIDIDSGFSTPIGIGITLPHYDETGGGSYLVSPDGTTVNPTWTADSVDPNWASVVMVFRAAPAQYGIATSSTGPSKVLSLIAPDKYIGAQSSILLPCAPGDTVTLTATARWLSGLTMRPIIGIWFWDQPIQNNVGAIQISPPNTDTGWHIASVTAVAPPGAAVMEVATWCEALAPGASSYFAGFVPFDPVPPPPATLPLPPTFVAWEVSDYRITQNGDPQYAPLDTFNPMLAAYAFLKEFVFPLYYLSLLTSQYQQAPNLYAWLATLIQPVTDLFACVQQEYQKFDLDRAQGVQLDVLGRVVGAARTLPYQPSTGEVYAVLTNSFGTGVHTATVNNTINMFVGQTVAVGGSDNVVISAVNPEVSFTATFTNSHFAGERVKSSGVNIDPTLGDADYLLLLRSKIAQNQWDGQIDSLYALWNALFPGGHILFIDNQDMTATIVLAGIFTALQQSMIVNGLIIPRPQAVLYNYVFAQLPIFGFDQDTAIIAGFDLGHFA